MSFLKPLRQSDPSDWKSPAAHKRPALLHQSFHNSTTLYMYFYNSFARFLYLLALVSRDNSAPFVPIKTDQGCKEKMRICV